MILHKRWGDILGLGNFMFKYASLLGLSKRYNTELYLPKYYMFDYFLNDINHDNNIPFDIEIVERFHKYDIEYWDQFKNDFITKNVNISLNSFLQSSKYWEDNEDYIKKMLLFKPDIINNIKEEHKESLSKKTIGISIRRGDFLNNPNFYQLPTEFFLYTLERYFSNWKDYNIVLFCDDYTWLKNTFKGNNIYYADDMNHPMKLLVYGSLLDNFIISNSTFSWWLAYLAVNCKEDNKGIVIHSGKNLSGCLENGSNVNDYYHKDWICSDFLSLNNINYNNLSTNILWKK
jgi:hypothetical protein